MQKKDCLTYFTIYTCCLKKKARKKGKKKTKKFNFAHRKWKDLLIIPKCMYKSAYFIVNIIKKKQRKEEKNTKEISVVNAPI